MKTILQTIIRWVINTFLLILMWRGNKIALYSLITLILVGNEIVFIMIIPQFKELIKIIKGGK